MFATVNGADISDDTATKPFFNEGAVLLHLLLSGGYKTLVHS
jgi:hypothetical protein